MLTFAYWTSPQDWLIVGLVVMVLFGGAKIPEFARGIGDGMREFKKAIDGQPEPEKATVPVPTPEPAAVAHVEEQPAATAAPAASK